MFKGFRDSIKGNKDGRETSVYFVKPKKYTRFTASVRVGHTGDIFIIAERRFYRNWHEHAYKQMIILHELGHLQQKYQSHFIDELCATFTGYLKYRHLAPLVNFTSPIQLIKLSWRYMLNKNLKPGNYDLQIQRLGSNTKKCS